MDLVSILATVILITTIGTMIVGVGAYFAFKIRDKRRPSQRKSDQTLNDQGASEPVFLTRYVPEAAVRPADAAGPDATPGP